MNLQSVGLPGLWHLSLFGFLLPFAAWRSARRLARVALPPRKRYYASVIVQQLVLGAISIWIARVLGIELFPPIRVEPLGLAAGAILLALAVALLYPRWVRAIEEGSRRVHLVSPRDGTERALWLGISLGAGVFEEISYRGVLFGIVAQLTGSPIASVVFCSFAFGLGHLVQGWTAALIIVGFAAGFHGLVIATGSLYLAMAVHVSYDVIAGFSYGRLAERRGLPLEPPAPVADPTDSLARTPS